VLQVTVEHIIASTEAELIIEGNIPEMIIIQNLYK
jgi:hypothetical protein